MNELIAEGEDINFIDNPNLDALEWSQKAIAMLRQQQEKINKYELRNIAQCDRIAILESQVYGGITK